MDSALPVSLPSVLAALLPLLVLLALLMWRGWSTSTAAPVALAVAALVAVTLFRTPLETIAVASGKGIWDAIFILYIVWPALILYRVANGANAFQAIQRGVLRLIPDRLMVILVFAWLLTSFIQSIAGFGAPLAVVAPILLGLGVKPLHAVLLPLIGGAWANSFGSLGAPWMALESVVEVTDQTGTLRTAALLVWIANLSGGLMIAWLYGGIWALRRGLPAILIISLLHGGLLFLLLPTLLPVAMLIACTVGLLAALALSQWRFYRQEDGDAEPDRIFDRDEPDPSADAAGTQAGQSPMTLALAFAPYLFLAVLAVVVLTVAPLREVLERVSVGPPFPATETGFGIVEEAVDAYAAFTPLTHPGTFLLLAALFGYLLFKRDGRYPPGTRVSGLVQSAAGDALPVTSSVTALRLRSAVRSHSGEITVLALGLSAVAGSMVYLASANFIAMLGALATSSSTASNVLFGPLQVTGAEAEGVPVPLVLGAQVAGSAVGNAISPADALLGATTVGHPSMVGALLRKAVPWAIGTGLLISLATVALYLFAGTGA
ncbi:MAG TPA: L-lactate permease [Chiayiivirga sp.]|nr:L-lactate permease [Chiayiivirga sp.]